METLIGLILAFVFVGVIALIVNASQDARFMECPLHAPEVVEHNAREITGLNEIIDELQRRNAELEATAAEDTVLLIKAGSLMTSADVIMHKYQMYAKQLENELAKAQTRELSLTDALRLMEDRVAAYQRTIEILEIGVD